MDWLENLLFNADSIAHIVLLYSFVIAGGVLLGKLKMFGVSLGVTFILFVGILMGHLGLTGNREILNFVQDFGLILFVFCIGLQVGPSFFSSFKKGGVTMNLIATGVVLLNIAVVTNTIPNTGISLPFFSYGGSSLVMIFFEMGIILSISGHSRMVK